MEVASNKLATAIYWPAIKLNPGQLRSGLL
jgi:hypothetical protein